MLNIPAELGPAFEAQAPSAAGLHSINLTVMVLVIVLLLHAGLIVADLLPGPRWLAATECMLVFLAGLSQLRRVTQEQETEQGQQSADQGMGMARPSLSASSPRIIR